MMTLQSAPDDQLFALLQQIRTETNAANDPLAKLRQAAWDAFLSIGLPSTREEVFRYITLRKLYARSYSSAKPTSLTPEAIAPWILPESKQSFLVFINGHFQPELSNRNNIPAAVVIEPLSKAFRTYGSFISNAWQRSINSERDPFALLNAALHNDAAFIYVPPKVVVDAPIQILSLIDTQDQAALIFPRWHLFAGSQSNVELILNEAILSGSSTATFSAFDTTIEENAHVKINQLTITDRDDNWHLASGRSFLKRNSILDAVSIIEGGEATRLDWCVALAGENAEANVSGLGLYNQNHEGHVHVLIEHQAPHCRSMQHYKNILRDASRSSFEGKIYVHQAAQKTDAFQLNNNLLFDNGMAYSKPNLEIFADDVKASHGATFGQLDEEQLFYLMARGFNQSLAQNILIQGFCSEIIEKISVPSILKEVSNATKSYIAAK